MIERMIEVNDSTALDVLSGLVWVILLTNRVLFYWTRRLGLFILKYVYGYRNVYENRSIYVIISLLSKLLKKKKRKDLQSNNYLFRRIYISISINLKHLIFL